MDFDEDDDNAPYPVYTSAVRIRNRHEINVCSMRLCSGHYEGFVEYEINGVLQTDRHAFHAGVFDTEEKALEAARVLALVLLERAQTNVDDLTQNQVSPVPTLVGPRHEDGRTLH